MLEEKTNEQTKLANKPGKKSSKKFKPGDKVIIQETTGRRKQWIETGIIDQARVSDNGTNQSFIITLDRGGSCLRNKRLRDKTTTKRDDEAQPNPPYMNTRDRSRAE